MEILGRMGADITDELGAALYNEDPAIRMAAVSLLSRNKNRATVLALGDALPYEPEIRIKKAIAESLGSIGDTAGIVILDRLLEDPDTGIRSAAIRSLGMIRDPAAVEPLSRQLGSDDDEVLYLAREALILQGTPACKHLAGLLPEGDHQLRTIVADILESLRCIPQDPERKACFLIGKERWYELETIGEPSLGPLRSTLTDTTTHARLGAVMAIGRIGGDEAAGLLITALNDDSPIVRKRAENALIAIGTPAASLLETARQSGRVRYPATAERILQKIRPDPDIGRQEEP
jgi:HEAT repeat protein